jgi:hypothetical protein
METRLSTTEERADVKTNRRENDPVDSYVTRRVSLCHCSPPVGSGFSRKTGGAYLQPSRFAP